MKTKKWVIEEWKDLEITGRFEDTVFDNSPHGYEFELYEVVGYEKNENGEYNTPLYERKGAIESGDFSINGLEDAQPYIKGFIKWDGCSHFWFGDEGYLHLCGLYQIEKVKKILKKLIDRAENKGVERL